MKLFGYEILPAYKVERILSELRRYMKHCEKLAKKMYDLNKYNKELKRELERFKQANLDLGFICERQLKELNTPKDVVCVQKGYVRCLPTPKSAKSGFSFQINSGVQGFIIGLSTRNKRKVRMALKRKDKVEIVVRRVK